MLVGAPLSRSRRQAGPPHGIGLQLPQAIEGGPTGPGRQKILPGGKGWLRVKEDPGSACSRRFSAGSRGEYKPRQVAPGEGCEVLCFSTSDPSGLKNKGR